MMYYYHNYMPFYSPFGPSLFMSFLPLLAALALAVVVLKGYALWCAARSNQKWWFIALLVINTLGILEIVYLIWFRPKTTDTRADEHEHHHHHAH